MKARQSSQRACAFNCDAHSFGHSSESRRRIAIARIDAAAPFIGCDGAVSNRRARFRQKIANSLRFAASFLWTQSSEQNTGFRFQFDSIDFVGYWLVTPPFKSCMGADVEETKVLFDSWRFVGV